METYDKIQYTSKETVRGVVLDLPSKGKTSETSVTEGMMSVCPAHFEDWPS